MNATKLKRVKYWLCQIFTLAKWPDLQKRGVSLNTEASENDIIQDPISVSIVVPVYAGAEYLTRLVDEVEVLRDAWTAQGAPFALAELILVYS